MVSVTVKGKTYTLDDMQQWFVQIRGFPSILCIGKGKNRVCGEGQFGGRQVTELVHEIENKFTAKIGQAKYQEEIDKIMRKKGQGGIKPHLGGN
jgi:enolase